MNSQLFENKLQKLAQQYEDTADWSVIQTIEQEFEIYLKNHPQDSETWIRFSIFLNQSIVDDTDRAIKHLEELLVRDNTNIRALLVLVEISYASCGFLEKKLFDALVSTKTNDHELMSMVEYLIANAYYREDKQKYERHLINSVNLYDKHVRNNERLGSIFIEKGKTTEGCALIRRAIRNIQCVFPEIYNYIGMTFNIIPVEQFIDYYIKGTYTTYSTMQDMGELYKKYQPINDSQ